MFLLLIQKEEKCLNSHVNQRDTFFVVVEGDKLSNIPLVSYEKLPGIFLLFFKDRKRKRTKTFWSFIHSLCPRSSLSLSFRIKTERIFQQTIRTRQLNVSINLSDSCKRDTKEDMRWEGRARETPKNERWSSDHHRIRIKDSQRIQRMIQQQQYILVASQSIE